jgi:hypothetical protein
MSERVDCVVRQQRGRRRCRRRERCCGWTFWLDSCGSRHELARKQQSSPRVVGVVGRRLARMGEESMGYEQQVSPCVESQGRWAREVGVMQWARSTMPSTAG